MNTKLQKAARDTMKVNPQMRTKFWSPPNFTQENIEQLGPHH
jgi:hypothetical protein